MSLIICYLAIKANTFREPTEVFSSKNTGTGWSQATIINHRFKKPCHVEGKRSSPLCVCIILYIYIYIMFSGVESERERKRTKKREMESIKNDKRGTSIVSVHDSPVLVLKGNLLLYAFIIKCHENIFTWKYVSLHYILLKIYHNILYPSFNIQHVLDKIIKMSTRHFNNTILKYYMHHIHL